MSTPFRTVLRSLIVVVLASACPAYAEYTRINEPNPADAMDVHIYELDNGLRVYLTENHETPRFYAEISVRAGSKHDPPDATGLAHYLEHLLFKGTRELGTLDYEKEQPYLERITELYEQRFQEADPDKRAAIYAEINRISQEAAQYAIPNEIDKLYNAMGGAHVNAHTWHEETVYKVGLPANRLEQWAVIESNRFVHPVFRLFHTELEIVYEEKNRSLDSKENLIQEAVDAALYKTHPYGQQPTIGTVEHLKNPSLEHISRYYNRYYVPNNMAIAISGDIDIEETIELIDDYFGDWERKPLPDAPTWDEGPLNGAERVTVQYEGEEYVLLAFRTVPNDHPDSEALTVLDMILDNAEAGLINLNLNQAQRVRAAGSYPALWNDHGAQYLWGIPKDEQTLEEVERLLLDQIAIIKRGEFEEWIIPAIVTDFRKMQKQQLESDQARVAIMRNAFLEHKPWDEVVAELDRMAQVTKDDVVRVANTYFADAYVAGYRLDAPHDVPSIEKPPIDPVAIDASRQSKFASRVLSMPTDPIEPTFVEPGEDYRHEKFANGVELYHAPNPLNDLFSFSIVVDVGTRHNNKLGFAAQLLDKSGTDRLSAEDLKKEWYKLGTSFGVMSGDNQTAIRISGLDENFGASLELMLEVLTRPQADEGTLEELKQIILVAREDAKKDPNTLSAALSQYHRYGEDSDFLGMLPTADVERLTREELFALVKGLLGYERTINYTGSLPLEKVKSTLKQSGLIDGDLKEPPPYRFLRARKPDETEIYFFDRDLAQSQVRIEFPDGTFKERQSVPSQLFNSYFSGGMSGIVFQELREARALAYSAAARYAQGDRVDDENLMIGFIASQTDKTPEAVEAFLELMDDMPESEERFEENVDALINRYRTSTIGFRGVIGAVQAWDRLDLPVDPRERRFRQLQKAKLKAVMNFHSDHVKERTKLISIVGDSARMDMERLAAIGNIVRVDTETIFVE